MKATITIQSCDQFGNAIAKDIEAYTDPKYAGLGIHKRDKQWVITHTASGLKIANRTHKKYAVALAINLCQLADFTLSSKDLMSLPKATLSHITTTVRTSNAGETVFASTIDKAIAEQACETVCAIAEGRTTLERVENCNRTLDMSESEWWRFQDLKSVYVGVHLTLEESQAVYRLLGDSVSDFNESPVACKAVLTGIFHDLLQYESANQVVA